MSIADILARKQAQKAEAVPVSNVFQPKLDKQLEVETPKDTLEETFPEGLQSEIYYLWHPESESLFTTEDEAEYHQALEEGSHELTKKEYDEYSGKLQAMREEQRKRIPDEVPGRLEDLVPVFSSIKEARESELWKKMKIMERLRLTQLLEKAQKLGPQAESKTSVPTEKVHEGAAPRVENETPQQRFFRIYPTVQQFVASDEFKAMNTAAQAHWLREYTKRAQVEAALVNSTMRQLEKHLTAEEQANALEQRKAGIQAKLSQDEKDKTFSLSVQLNEEQQLGVEYATSGKCFVLTGAAGTGKTTACREIARAFLQRGNLGEHTFKIPGVSGPEGRVTAPGIAFVSYTRRATANIRRALHKDPELEQALQHNVTTIHALLEYEPEFFTKIDEKTGESKSTMRFIPKRDAKRPLDIKVLVIEEASMLGLDLWEKVYAAMRKGIIIVFVGDINQLPPVFGKSIMNYALGQLPVIELKRVYRQEEDSGIIENAHRILKGEEPIANKDTEIVTGKSPTAVGQEKMSRALGAMFFQLWSNKDNKGQRLYDPEQDIILSPWNKQPCGTDNLNSWISQFLGEERKAMVHEVLAGRRKMYLAVGDRVMYEKRDGIIKAIRHNAQYLGKAPQPASTDLTRFGLRKLAADAISEDFELTTTGYENINIDEVPDEEKKLQASHVIELTLDDGSEEVLSAVGDFAEQVFSLGYCLTVHKAQGCEWRKVFVVLHKDHTLGGFLTRELVYTAATRAREKLILIAKQDVLTKAVKRAEIKGNTLDEKIQSINSGAANIGTYPVIK